MKSIIRKSHDREHNYTVISNSIINDEKLGMKEMAVLIYILSKPDDWETYVSQLAKRFSASEDTIYNSIKKLESLGYVNKERLRGKDGKYTGYAYTFFESPLPKKPDMENRALLSTDIKLSTDLNIGNTPKPHVSKIEPTEPKDYYNDLNNLLQRNTITETEIKAISTMNPLRVLYYQVLLRCLRELKQCNLTIDPKILGYLKGKITDSDLNKLADVERIVSAVRASDIKDVAPAISIIHRVILSLNGTMENYMTEPFSYERLEQAIQGAKLYKPRVKETLRSFGPPMPQWMGVN